MCAHNWIKSLTYLMYTRYRFTVRHEEDDRRHSFDIRVEHPHCRLRKTWLEQIIFASQDNRTDITGRELRSFLDHHHVGSRACRFRWMEGETISWDAEDQSGNTITRFAWLSHSCCQCSSVPDKTEYGEKQTESEENSIPCRGIEDQQSNWTLWVVVSSLTAVTPDRH